MTSDIFPQPEERPGWVRLRTLIYLRWLAVIGQTGALLVATQILDLQIRLDVCALLIGLSVLFNIVATLIYPENRRLDQRDATLTLLFDVAQLAALLYFTGGMSNPFAVLILAQSIIAATVLTLRSTLFLGLVSLAVIAVLTVLHDPLHTADGQILSIPPLLLVGTWAALSISVVFMGTYVRRVSMERYSMAEALTATQLALEREQKLTTLGGVVAAAAHELGTPLATIKLVSSELLEELSDRPELAEDARLIREQANRCRDILASMGRSGKDDRHIRQAPLSAVVAEAAEPHMRRDKSVIIRIKGTLEAVADAADQPVISRRSEIIHGLRNLVQNAVDFADRNVWIDLDWTDDRVTVRVGDDGPGYPGDLIGRIGDPFVRPREDRISKKHRPGYQGMGLGLFIAKTLLERTGADLTFANGIRSDTGAKAPDPATRQPSGAIVEVRWKRDDIQISRTVSRGALGENLSIAD